MDMQPQPQEASSSSGTMVDPNNPEKRIPRQEGQQKLPDHLTIKHENVKPFDHPPHVDRSRQTVLEPLSRGGVVTKFEREKHVDKTVQLTLTGARSKAGAPPPPIAKAKSEPNSPSTPKAKTSATPKAKHNPSKSSSSSSIVDSASPADDTEPEKKKRRKYMSDEAKTWLENEALKLLGGLTVNMPSKDQLEDLLARMHREKLIDKDDPHTTETLRSHLRKAWFHSNMSSVI